MKMVMNLKIKMIIKILVLFVFVISSYLAENSDDESTLKLVHVMFRHGNRTPEESENYPKDPYINYKFFPIGCGELTNVGKQNLFSLGTTLRQKYNNFLGPYYYDTIGEFWTTDYNRCKMSLELVLASLFPPKLEEIWNSNLNWQPIPYRYNNSNNDKILWGFNCPYMLNQYSETVNTPEIQNKIKKHENLFSYISENTGWNVTTFAQVETLYSLLTSEELLGLELPEWTKSVYPNPISEVSSEGFTIFELNPNIIKMVSGYLIEKIINDTQKQISNITESNEQKINLYSAHDINIAGMLILLNSFELHNPPYGSHIIFELHLINNTYGFKIYYSEYEQQLLEIPGCSTFCPLDTFVTLVDKYIPSDDLCNKV